MILWEMAEKYGVVEFARREDNAVVLSKKQYNLYYARQYYRQDQMKMCDYTTYDVMRKRGDTVIHPSRQHIMHCIDIGQAFGYVECDIECAHNNSVYEGLCNACYCDFNISV